VRAEVAYLQVEVLALLDALALAVSDPDDPVGNVEHLQVVGRGDDGDALLLVQLLEERDDLLAGLEVEVTGRLVGEDDPGSFASARAIATLCCWPPESSDGL